MSKMWALLVHLTNNWLGETKRPWAFDEECWDKVIDECAKNGINTIVIDTLDGIRYDSHPEIALDEAWSTERVRQEVKRCQKLGIKLIPKLNFATPHDGWMGDYQRMVSSKIYHKVCEDLINEVYDLFDKPDYIHLGMDEENAEFCSDPPSGYVIYRKGEALWSDLRFFADCVLKTGAKPWIWHNWLFWHPEEFKARFSTDEIVISPYHYNAFRKEHFTPISINAVTAAYYSSGVWSDKDIEFVEEDPFFDNFHAQAIPNAKYGYKYVPTASVYNDCIYNTPDIVEHFRDNAPDSSIIGFMTGPWQVLTPKFIDKFIESIILLGNARKEFYPNDK